MYKLVNSVTWRRKLKKMQTYVKNVDFWPDLHEICGCYGNVKYDGHTPSTIHSAPNPRKSTNLKDNAGKSSQFLLSEQKLGHVGGCREYGRR